METADHTGKAAPAARTTDPARGEPALVASEHPFDATGFGPQTATLALVLLPIVLLLVIATSTDRNLRSLRG